MASQWKIYTRKGDKGETSLIGGTRVPKNHIRIEAYGTLDELNSYIGLIRDFKIGQQYRKVLLEIQNRLFTAESLLASDKNPKINTLPCLEDKDIAFLENEIDQMNEGLPALNSFILPGGHPVVSHCHIARCICRRAERVVIELSDNHHVDMLVVKYLNRLSDYLFVLARKLAYNLNAPETIWNART